MAQEFTEETVRVLEVHYPGGEVEQVTLRLGDVVDDEHPEMLVVVLASPSGTLYFRWAPMLWYSLRETTIKKKIQLAGDPTAKNAGQAVRRKEVQ